MARTRSSKPNAKESQDNLPSSIQTKSLPPSDPNPTKLFILPKNSSRDARIVTLRDPATNQPSRFFLCPEKGFYEFKKIAAPRADPHSWLLSQNANRAQDAHKLEEGEDNQSIIGPAYLSRSQDLFIATPMDAMLILVPILSPDNQTSKGNKKSMFITFDDHIDMAYNIPTQLKSLLLNSSFRPIFERRLHAICDVVDAGEDSMFRVSYPKLATTVLNKAIRAAEMGLPLSMEDRFITRVLQTPFVSTKREQSAMTENTITVSQETESSDTKIFASSETATQITSIGSQSNMTSVMSTFSSATTLNEIDGGRITAGEVQRLLRIRTALNFILRSYIPKYLHTLIEEEISKTNLVNFEPLDKHLADLNKLQAEAQALRIISDNISRKRDLEEDEGAEMRAEKKRRKEEEEKKKKSESRAIKDLKKADTSGMKKLSSFFTKGSKKEAKT
jgi:Ydr279p protein family (RNase H2 complex component) wHTH domain/Ydr279p protein triple barrel domain